MVETVASMMMTSKECPILQFLQERAQKQLRLKDVGSAVLLLRLCRKLWYGTSDLTYPTGQLALANEPIWQGPRTRSPWYRHHIAGFMLQCRPNMGAQVGGGTHMDNGNC